MRIPPAGSPEQWFAWLVGPDDELRSSAKLALGGLEPNDDIPLTPLLTRLGDSNDEVVFWALVALKRMGERAREAVRSISAIAASHPAFGVRQAAVCALPSVGPSDPATIPALRGALRDISPFVRRESLQSLAAVPHLGSEDLEAVAAMATDDDEAVARWSEIALRNIRLRRAPQTST